MVCERMRLLSIIFVLLTAFGCTQNVEQWTIAFKTDAKGSVISGSTTHLVQVIRNGGDVKIGWGFKGENHSIEHLSEPIWLGILDGQEVLAHLDPQVLSAVDWVELRPNYADSTLAVKEWRVAISTKGDFDAIWYNRKNNKVVERRPQQHPITWFVRKSDFQAAATPLFEE